jgi:pimeloyl-ACP methyl ester carboxylesterase
MDARTAGGVSAVRVSTGITVSYREAGSPEAPAVVLLHPWLESGDAFSLVLPHLVAAGLWVLAPDLRGCGGSDKPPDGYDLSSLAADVVAFLDAVGVASAIVVGASSGGYVAQAVAASYPGRVDGLVLAGAPRSLQGRTPPFAAELADLRDPIEKDWARDFVESFAAPGTVPEEFLAARLRDALAVPAAIWRESLDALIRSEPPMLHRISAPTLVVGGARDSLLGRDAEELVAAIRGARLVEYADAGHVVHWEAPERLARDVVAFARAVRRQRRGAE